MIDIYGEQSSSGWGMFILKLSSAKTCRDIWAKATYIAALVEAFALFLTMAVFQS